MIARSRAHLHGAGEDYRQHFRFATNFGLLAIAAGIAALVHAIIPGICTASASRIIRHLGQMLEDRSAIDAAEAEAVEASAFAMLLLGAAVTALPLWLFGAPMALKIGYSLFAFALPAALMVANREVTAPSEPAA